MLTLVPSHPVAPTLVIAVGNPDRGDDALGPLVAERVAALALPHVEVLVDFQLQIEHIVDLARRTEVIFVDASASGDAPYTWRAVAPAAGRSAWTHALSPPALLDGFRRITGTVPPAASVVAVRGYAFGLGRPLSARASTNLEAAYAALATRLQRSSAEARPAGRTWPSRRRSAPPRSAR